MTFISLMFLLISKKHEFSNLLEVKSTLMVEPRSPSMAAIFPFWIRGVRLLYFGGITVIEKDSKIGLSVTNIVSV